MTAFRRAYVTAELYPGPETTSPAAGESPPPGDASSPGTSAMPQCDNCMDHIDEDEDAHVEVVKPMEFKGETRKVTQYYCTVECLLETVAG